MEPKSIPYQPNLHKHRLTFEWMEKYASLGKEHFSYTFRKWWFNTGEINLRLSYHGLQFLCMTDVPVFHKRIDPRAYRGNILVELVHNMKSPWALEIYMPGSKKKKWAPIDLEDDLHSRRSPPWVLSVLDSKDAFLLGLIGADMDKFVQLKRDS